jgi:hypothetical protein
MSQRYSSNLAKVHLSTLVNKHGIRVRWCNGRNWMSDALAYHAAWQVTIPHPYTVRQYMVALHELGHLLGPIGPDARNALPATEGEHQLLWEASAWGWAVTNVHAGLYEAITPKVWDSLIAETLGGHLWEMSLLANGQGTST